MLEDLLLLALLVWGVVGLGVFLAVASDDEF